MPARRPRILLGTAAVVLVLVLAALAVATSHNRGTERDSAKQRFTDAANVSASLTGSIFSSSAPASAQTLAATIGKARDPHAALAAKVKADRVDYGLLLDGAGHPLATAGTVPAEVTRRLATTPDYLKHVLGQGELYRLGSFTPGGRLEYAIAFQTTAGRRVLVEGFSPAIVAALLESYLSDLPNADHQQAYVVDRADRVVVGPPDAAPGKPLPPLSGAVTRVHAPIAGSEWSVVLAERNSALYHDVSDHLRWLAIVALALAAAVALAFLLRAISRDRDLQRSYEEIARMNAELRRSNDELAQFAAVASHDLQEPLRKVIAFGDQLERRHADGLSPDGRDLVTRMRAASLRMSGLIDDLLRFSRVTTDTEAPARVELGTVADDVVSDLGALIAETGGHVEIGALPAVSAAPTQMRQLLQNLIANGLKFHRPGVPPEVLVEATPRGFTVTDNGIGFEPEFAERIFGVFERLHTRDAYAGSGIGLAVCRKIVERHGGTIVATGRPGEGAVFTVELPSAAAPAREPVHA